MSARQSRAAALAVAWLVGGTSWAAALLAAPYIVTHRAPHQPAYAAASGVYLLGHLVCHQRASRSFHLWGVQLPVCARCTGLYAATPLGAGWALALAQGRAGRRRRTNRGRLVALAAVPTVVTLALEGLGGAWVSNLIRAIAALPLGGAAAWAVSTALVEDAATRAGWRLR